MLSPTTTTIRLAIHILAATIWVGGQFALAGVVPTLRSTAPDAIKPAARAFARLAWPAFVVLVVTGVWNLTAVHLSETSTEYQITVFVKITLAIASGAFTLVHQLGRTKLALALGGALGAVTALAALFLGVLLRTGTN